MRSLLSLLRLAVLWDRLRTNFWFTPAIMAAMGVALSFAMTRLDAALDRRAYDSFALLYLFGPEGARAILSAIASSMITVAGITFSITMLTLQLASSQFGPRVLRNFMRDRGNQVVLGTFISTFVYCLLVLRTVKGVEGDSFVPHLSVAFGVLLAISSLAILIYFIHHTAHSIRIETLLQSLAAETESAIVNLYPDRVGEAPGRDDSTPLPDFGRAGTVRPAVGGYVQAIDAEALLTAATRHDLVLEIAARPGAFVTTHDALMRVAPAERLSDEVARALAAGVVVGAERTPDQDLAFSIQRIVEIAQRSLSPGINDPTTALYCIDRLREAFVRLAERDIPAGRRLDDNGHLRIITQPATLEDLACPAFAAVARYAGADSDVREALAAAIDRVLDVSRSASVPRLVDLRFELRQRRSIAAR